MRLGKCDSNVGHEGENEMIVISIIVSIVLTFLSAWVIMKLGTYIIGSKEGTWKNCALLNTINYGVIAILIGLGLITAQGPGFFIMLLYFALVIGAIWFMFRVTMNILDITFGNCIMLEIVMWGLSWFAAFLLGKLEVILPGMQILTDWLTF